MKKLFLTTLILALAMILTLPAAAELTEEEDEFSLDDLFADAPEAIREQVTDVTVQEDGTIMEDVETVSVLEEDGSILLTITATGDFTIGGDTRKSSSIWAKELKKQGGDPNFTLVNVRDILFADDMTLVNFEGTLTNTTKIPSSKKGNDFLFSAPPEYAAVLAENSVEAVSLENNHVNDHGDAGYRDTQEALDAVGIVWSNSDTVGVYEVKGVKIAMLSYLCIDRWSSLWDKVPQDIAAAKKKYPVVIVSFHWGYEKDYAPRDNQVKMGRLAVDSGADLVIGHHSHRINPIEYYNGVYICYSLGNFCFAGNNKPDDMNSYIFQTRLRITPEEGVKSDGFRIIPISISSSTSYNNFQPTLLTTSTTIDSVMTTLRANGRKLTYAVDHYPMDWED